MSNPAPPKPAPPPGSIDFELTDFDDARQAMDELPAGVAEVQHTPDIGACSWSGSPVESLATRVSIWDEGMH